MDNAKAVKAYLKLRDARTALKREYEEADLKLTQQQERIEKALLHHLNETKTNSVATDYGTFYRQEVVTPTGSDWEAFYDWVKKNDAFDALEKRIKKTFITEYMEEHKGAIPPGVSVYREYVVRIRRS